MRILQLTDGHYPLINGITIHVDLLVNELQRMGHEVEILAAGPPHEDDGPNVIRYRGVPLIRHYHAGIPLSARAHNALRNAQILHTHHPFQSGAIAVAASRVSGAPLVYTSHTRFDVYAHVHTPWVPAAKADQIVGRFMRMVSRTSDAIIVPSLGSAEAHTRWGVTDRVHHIPNGVDLSSFVAPQVADRDALGIPRDAPVAVYVGRFHLEKNVHGLIDAYRIACQSESQSRLLLVGDGPKLQSIRNMVADYGMTERVVFAGLRPYDEVPGLLAASDFLVSASTSETHPLTFIEAAAAGLPALGISSPGIADIIVDGETGFLVHDSGEEFARCFVTLATDVGLRHEMGRKARIHSHAFSARATAEAVVQLYEELLAAREPRVDSLPLT